MGTHVTNKRQDRGPADAGEGARWEARTSIYVTSHWRSGACPETFPALPRFLDAVAALDGEVVGHGHPRERLRSAATWERLGIRYEPDPDVVLAGAGLLISDNTSLAFEAAACGIPNVCLNDRSYRRDVEHGLRFWSHVPGLQCDEPEDLAETVARARAGEGAELGRKAADYVYGCVDGNASVRAADAILALGEPVSEVRDHLDEILDRLDQLGATDEELDGVRDSWPEMDAEERERLRRMNDGLLTAEIRQTRADNDFHSRTPAEQDAVDAAADEARLERLRDDAAWEILRHTIPGVLEQVGEVDGAVRQVALARRLHRLESSADKPRTSLLKALEQIR